MYPALLSLLSPTHITISLTLSPLPSIGGFFPFRAFSRWTKLSSITLVDVYPLSEGPFYLAVFVFAPVAFERPVDITFDFTTASQEATGLEDVHVRLLFTNMGTKGIVRVSKLGKVVVKVRSEMQNDLVEHGRPMFQHPALNGAEVVLAGEEAEAEETGSLA